MRKRQLNLTSVPVKAKARYVGRSFSSLHEEMTAHHVHSRPCIQSRLIKRALTQTEAVSQPIRSLPQTKLQPIRSFPRTKLRPTKSLPQTKLQPIRGLPQINIQPNRSLPQTKLQPIRYPGGTYLSKTDGQLFV